MRAINRRRVFTTVMVVSATIATGACAPHPQTASTPPESVPLEVNNRSDFEVVVYALSSPTSVGYRLGNARSFAMTTMSVPPSALRGDVLVIRLHAIGTPARLNWTSGDALIDANMIAQLDIRADGSGDMSPSMLYTGTMSLSRAKSFGRRQP